jgi:hypothetical protein
VLLSADRDGSVIAHPEGIHIFPGAGQPIEVPDGLGAHLLAAGGFSRAARQLDRGTMHLQKDRGGCEITHRKVVYAWPEDDSVCEVPDELGANLLGIRGGGYRVVLAPEPEKEPDGPDGEGAGPGADGDPEGEDPAGRDEQGGDSGEGDSVAEKPAKPARGSRAKPSAA